MPKLLLLLVEREVLAGGLDTVERLFVVPGLLLTAGADVVERVVVLVLRVTDWVGLLPVLALLRTVRVEVVGLPVNVF